MFKDYIKTEHVVEFHLRDERFHSNRHYLSDDHGYHEKLYLVSSVPK